MAEKNKEYTFGPQPYQFGQEEVSTAPPAPSAPEEPTGVENIGYDNATMQGAPDNPKNAREVVERGVVNVANPLKSEPPAASTDVEQVIPAVSPEQQELNDAVAGIDRKIAAWRKYWASLPEPEDDETRAKREKLEKSKRIIGAVSDGLRAMSNLWFTTKYAPNMYDHENESQLKATNQWIDKAKADREKLRDEHLRFAIGLGDAENERAKTLRELKTEQEKRKIARNKVDQDNQRFEWEKALQGDKQAEQKSKTKKAQHEAEIAETKSEYEPLQQEADLKKKGAQTNASNASAANSYASAQEKWNKGVVFMGKRYNDSDAYKKAVTRYAKDLGIPLQKDQDKIGRDRVGKPAIVKVKVNRSVEDLASEVERRVEQKNREMTAPHKRKNNNSKPPTRR